MLRSRLDALSKKQKRLAAQRPLSASATTRLKEYFDVEWTFNSNAIEGSTLSLRETEVILHRGLTVGGKPLREHLEAINHKHAIDFVESLATNDEPISEHSLRQIHALILKGIDDEEAGRYRRGQVRISGTEYVPPDALQVPVLMTEFIDWLTKSSLSSHPISRAAEAHFRFVHIHPFSDGNGRSARLLMNLLLFGDGYPPAIVRNADRLSYYEALDRAHAGDMRPFVELIADAAERSLDVVLAAHE